MNVQSPYPAQVILKAGSIRWKFTLHSADLCLQSRRWLIRIIFTFKGFADASEMRACQSSLQEHRLILWLTTDIVHCNYCKLVQSRVVNFEIEVCQFQYPVQYMYSSIVLHVRRRSLRYRALINGTQLHHNTFIPISKYSMK